jgi:antitoxin component of RelBE/YafQ-DinJ toxin-antitoxin module
VLCSKKQLAKLGIDLTDAHRAASNYICGGEADVWLDIVSDKNHLFIQTIKELKSNGRNKISSAA